MPHPAVISDQITYEDPHEFLFSDYPERSDDVLSPFPQPPANAFHFTHTPPKQSRTMRLWPQLHPIHGVLRPTFQHIWPHTIRYLPETSQKALAKAMGSPLYGPLIHDLPLTPPWPPLRRRVWGFGRSRVGASTSYHLF